MVNGKKKKDKFGNVITETTPLKLGTDEFGRPFASTTGDVPAPATPEQKARVQKGAVIEEAGKQFLGATTQEALDVRGAPPPQTEEERLQDVKLKTEEQFVQQGLLPDQQVQELPPEQLPPVQAQVVIGGETMTEEDVAKGLFSGSVTPVTDDDIFSVATLLAGGGLISGIGKAGAKKFVGKQTGNRIASQGKNLLKLGNGFFKKAGLAVGAVILGLTVKELTQGKISEIETTVGKYGETTSKLLTQVRTGWTSPAEAQTQLRAMEAQLAVFEAQVNNAGILGLGTATAKITGEYTSVITEIEKIKIEIDSARGEILQATVLEPQIAELHGIIQAIREESGV